MSRIFRPRAALLGGVHAAGLQRRFDVFKHGEPGKQREALEDDGDVELGGGDRLVVPVDLARRGRRKPGQHAQQGGFARARRAEQREDLAGYDGQVGGRDHLDAVLAGLRVVLFNAFGTDDRLRHRILLVLLNSHAAGRELWPAPGSFAPVSVSLSSTRRMSCGALRTD